MSDQIKSIRLSYIEELEAEVVALRSEAKGFWSANEVVIVAVSTFLIGVVAGHWL